MIKDEVYVSMMYTSPEKYRRDRRRFNVNPANGDRLTYVHLNKPEFVLGGWKFKFRFKTRDWHARILRHCRWLRKLMPGWHAKEKDFRSWYQGLVGRLHIDGAMEIRLVAGHPAITGERNGVPRYPLSEAGCGQAAGRAS